MNSPRTSLLVATAALALNGAIAIGWLIHPWLMSAGWIGRLLTLGLGLGPAVAAVVIIQRQLSKEQRTVLRHLDLLTRTDPLRALADQSAAAPPIPAQSPWSNVCRGLSEKFAGLASDLQEVDHRRAALEVRVRRATDRSEWVEAILQTLANPVIAVDQFDEVQLANRSAEQLFDLDTQNKEQRALTSLVRCDALVDLVAETNRRKVSTSRTTEIELAGTGNTTRCYRVTASNLMRGSSAQGQNASQGAVAVLTDITTERAQQKRHAEFVSSVSHEMKAPLAGIKAYVEMLLDGDAQDEHTREEFLGVISAQSNRLQRLVENLLNIARIEAGVIQVEKAQHSLNELLAEAVEVMQPSAVEKRIDLQTELSPMYLEALVDRDMLSQIAINLLSNAIKYTPRDGRVVLRSRMHDDCVQFSVEDTGVGLSAEDCRRVFEKFYRVAKDREMASGTGLGLPLVKSIVEDVLGGAITVESTLGVGSVFTVTLPSAGQLSNSNSLQRALQTSAL